MQNSRREQDFVTSMARGEMPEGCREEHILFTDVGGGRVSFYDNGESIYPRREWWVPSTDRPIRCYVSTMETKAGKVLHHAIPCNMEDARRRKEIAPLHNNIKILPLKRDKQGNVSGFMASGRKRIIVLKGSGIKITEQELAEGIPVALMVAEKDSAFVALCRISDKAADSLLKKDDDSVRALVRQAEAVGLELEFQRYWVRVDDGYYNAPEELCVKPDASVAEIKRAYHQRAARLSPDRCIARENKLAKALTGKEASAETIAEIYRNFRICKASSEHMLMLRRREDAINRYAQSGANALGRRFVEAICTGMEVLGYLQTAREAKSENGDSAEMVANGLAAIGYPDVGVDASLSRVVAVTLAGWLAEARAKAAKDKAKAKKPATPRKKATGKAPVK